VVWGGRATPLFLQSAWKLETSMGKVNQYLNKFPEIQYLVTTCFYNEDEFNVHPFDKAQATEVLLSLNYLHEISHSKGEPWRR
jgi:hypothetical protein